MVKGRRGPGGFRGIFMRDQLAELPDPRPNTGYILNTDLSSGPGKHWVGLHVAKGRAFYYDPYGKGAMAEAKAFTRRAGLPLTASRQKHQHNRSQHCGRYVLEFLKAMRRPGDPMANFTAFTTEAFTPGAEEQNNGKIRKLYGLA